jgi:hypothetical protein
MVPDYETGKIVHVLGPHETLERALARFPVVKPFDLVDAAFWGWYYLRHTALPGRISTVADERLPAIR